jgi:hypothetical protein
VGSHGTRPLLATVLHGEMWLNDGHAVPLTSCPPVPKVDMNLLVQKRTSSKYAAMDFFFVFYKFIQG